jgi:hypothetical protein
MAKIKLGDRESSMRALKVGHASSGALRSKPDYKARPVKGQVDYAKLRKKITVRYSKTLAYLAR